MNDNILTNEQWSELWKAIHLFDQTDDRTVLNRMLSLYKMITILLRLISVIVSIMNDLVESLDDDSQMNECNDVEKQFVITSIEIELAEMIAVNGIF
jgi:NAD(P)H-nitrite reductase large subunit